MLCVHALWARDLACAKRGTGGWRDGCRAGFVMRLTPCCPSIIFLTQSFNRFSHPIVAQEGVSAEVINLRSIKPLDRDTLFASVKKTHRLAFIEEGWPTCGVGAEVRFALGVVCCAVCFVYGTEVGMRRG